MLELFAIAVFSLWVWIRLRKDLLGGLCLAVALLVCLPTYLRITLPPPLPALTIHRIILLELIWFWATDHNINRDLSSLALRRSFTFWAIVSGFAVICTSVGFITSLKDYLDDVFEILFFFIIISTVVRDRDTAIRLLRAVWMGLVVVAILAIIERYTRFNPVDRFISGYDRGKGYNDVVATYPQRILLGTGMAMAWPLAYALGIVRQYGVKIPRLVLWLSAVLFLAACYFALSRGPWLAAVVAGLVLAALGSAVMRKRLLVVAVAAALALVVRPGMLGTLTGMAEMTTDVESQKGGTFLYRLELWKIAWSQVCKSPLRLLAGYGLGAGRETELSVVLAYRDKDYIVDSWDNHFAYDLYQTGVLGLLASLLLHGGAALMLFQLWRRARSPEKDFLGCCLATVMAMLFMMTNVLIFAKQVNFIFWSVFAAGMACGGFYGSSEVAQNEEEPASEEDSDALENSLASEDGSEAEEADIRG